MRVSREIVEDEWRRLEGVECSDCLWKAEPEEYPETEREAVGHIEETGHPVVMRETMETELRLDAPPAEPQGWPV